VRIEPFRMERMQSKYENYVDFNLSESGVHPMRVEELLDGAGGAARLLASTLGYNQSNGTEELRQRIALAYEGATRDNVLVTNGGSEANYATLWSLLEPSDRVAYMLPNYLQTWGLSRAYAGRTHPFRLVRRAKDGRGRWALDVVGLRRAATRGTRAILVTNPNNPTGATLSEGEMDEVVRAARRVGAWIVADEIYRGAEVDGDETPSFWGRYDRLLITSGLSKAFGLPGLRIGWVVGPAREIDRIWSRRDYTTIAPSTLSDHLARIALEPARREAILARTRAILRSNLPIVEAWLRERPGLFDFVGPRAGAILFARTTLPLGSQALAERLRRERSVLVVPGDQFGTPRHIRIGFGSEADYLRAGLARIDGFLRDLRKERRPSPAYRRSGSSASRSRRASRRAASRSPTRPSSCIS
jgi:aspartate/methionine/tyrosine aminotransferase